MELFHASVTEKKKFWGKANLHHGKEKAGRSDGGPVGLMPSWKGRWGPRAVPYCIAKGGCLYMTTELSSQHASFCPRSKKCHHRCFKTVTSLSKDVARDLFHTAYIKCNPTNTPTVYPALVITRLRNKLGTTEISIITTISHEGHVELKHKAICLKSLSSLVAEPGQEDGVSCGSIHQVVLRHNSKSLCIQPVYPRFTFAAEKVCRSGLLLSLQIKHCHHL